MGDKRKMTKEELEKEAKEYADWFWGASPSMMKALAEAYIKGAEPREKQIAELEEKISVLLSCKNCPENKGGFICVKEYENKCLAQKIQYIKELKEDNSEWEKASDKWKSVYELTNKQLTKAKEIIKELLNLPFASDEEVFADVSTILGKAEQFLKYSEVEK